MASREIFQSWCMPPELACTADRTELVYVSLFVNLCCDALELARHVWRAAVLTCNAQFSAAYLITRAVHRKARSCFCLD